MTLRFTLREQKAGRTRASPKAHFILQALGGLVQSTTLKQLCVKLQFDETSSST